MSVIRYLCKSGTCTFSGVAITRPGIPEWLHHSKSSGFMAHGNSVAILAFVDMNIVATVKEIYDTLYVNSNSVKGKFDIIVHVLPEQIISLRDVNRMRSLISYQTFAQKFLHYQLLTTLRPRIINF